MKQSLLLAQLNAEQKKAVTHGGGPLLIVAGAGTGKTTVVTRRIAWLIEQGKAEPEHILALTFTEKAAAEMEERVDVLLPYGMVDMWIATFHSFGERILRERALDLGLDSGFTVLTAADQWLLIRRNLAEFPLDYYRPLGNPTRFISALVKHISRLKDENISPEAYLEYAKKRLKKAIKKSEEEQAEAKKILEVAQSYGVYQQLLHDQGVLDFGDLIMSILRLFRERPAILEEYRAQFKYILVDEFQDTNLAQYQMVKLIAQPSNNLTVCGDDDQSIFKFRGASLSNILEFKKDFPDSREVVLTKNYRSKQNILDISYEFIQLNNPNRLEARLAKDLSLNTPITKQLRAERPGEGIIEHHHSPTVEQEVGHVIQKILQLRKSQDLNWNDVAILIRANDMAERFMNSLAGAGIPYQFIAAKGLFQKPEIIDLISYLKVVDDYHDSIALYRVLAMPIWGIPMKELITLLHFAHRESITLYEAMQRRIESRVSAKAGAKIDHVLAMLDDHIEQSRHRSVGQIAYQFVQSSGYLKKLTKEDSTLNAERILNLNRFFAKISEFESKQEDVSVKHFVQQLELLLEVGQDPAPGATFEGPEAVKILTVHSAKGLEFRYVFVVHLVDKRFPSIERGEAIEVPSDVIPEHLPDGDVHTQEERRLFYVAMTRAKDGLFFTTAESYGTPRPKKLSRFMKELAYDRYITAVSNSGASMPENASLASKPKEKLTYIHPDKLSFTQLKSFWTCPYQYRFAFLLKVPPEPKSTYSYGKSLHNTLKDVFQEVQRRGSFDRGKLRDLFESHWLTEWYESPEHMQERKEQGWKSLNDYLDSQAAQWPKVWAVEKGFKLRLGGQIIKGFIDRIDQFPDGSVEIIDYKTGQAPKSGKPEDPEQLHLYAMACLEIYKLTPSKLTYHYLTGNVPISFAPNEKAIERTREKVSRTISELEKSNFEPKPGFHCQFCDFREICEYRKS